MFVLADDLTGAAETAAALMSPGRPARIALSVPVAAAALVVTDLDSRHHPRAFDLVREALAHAGDRRVFVKVDSLLRGDVAATVAACLDAPVVFAPALPSAGRTVVGGVPYVHGVPLRETRAWRAEPRPAPATVAEALGDVPWVHVPVGADLPAVLATGRVAVCDAETDADLDAIVAATLGGPARLIGSGGLATALGRALNAARPSATGSLSLDAGSRAPGSGSARLDAGSRAPGSGSARLDSAAVPGSCTASPANGRLLVVVGTAEPRAAGQVRLLVEHGFTHVTLRPPDAAVAGPDAVGPGCPHVTAAERVRDALTSGPVVLTVSGPALTRALAEVVREALGETPADLVLTGGETARRVLDALGVRELIPLDQVHHGAVHSRTPQGHSVVTRPGSFGTTDSLLRIATHLNPDLRPNSDPTPTRT
ncbi:four-carbon acid sugar kinase family protein [Nonomuraea angiospora]|uniref:4-hydroxythreonine-4-phosphate dehydrogenase n=1 Tax=Nonomuraea angiospora TaxID=46172 RepID=A0ABR9LXR5_9ACTN|nr:four-carbon acid sugar kinase family protein [Nonomuraea angiospora]MBE1585436.1 4-hydroxythreonine-4-phosphate dehydrogenase [Nonomuraea angiospora]